ncbi:MAG: M20/M25/M40 family metallo-hydrolase [Bacteroidales bacterium]|nr:M20/M25/M40 family metallo-hydrolase [Bacteroidales bacterium]
MMKKVLMALFIVAGVNGFAQAPHLFEYEYPVVATENPTIRALMDSVSVDSIEATITHLCSYQNRRCDSRHIYDVQNWLSARYASLAGIDTVMLHDFKMHKEGFPEETADNVLAIQWGVTKPEEYVICGAHYDSWNGDTADPDTVRAPGADDNATGVAGIWETARLLSRYKFDRTIIYANWNAEEIGLFGSEAYAKECAENRMAIVGYFNMDMNGYLQEGTDIHMHVVYVDQDSLLAQMFFDVCHTYFPNMPVRQNWMPHGDSDFSSFNRSGYPALHPFEDVYASSPYIHSDQDVLGLSVNNLGQSRLFAQINLGAVAHLAGLNLSSVEEHDMPSVAMFPNPAKDAVQIQAEEGLQHIVICNLLGQQVATMDLDGQDQHKINTSGFVPGIYIVKTSTRKGVATQRLVVW